MDPLPYLQELLIKGGVVMWIILACSIVAVFIVLERLWHYHRAQIAVPEFLGGLINVLRRNNAVEAVAICDETPGPVAQAVRAAVLHPDKTEEELRHAVEEAAMLEIPRLERNLKTLATITHITPLLGLLGTVVGMIGAFQTIEAEGTFVTTGQLAGDIWEALLTTAAGLSVAIPAAAFYNFLHGRVESLILDMEKAGAEIVHYLRTHRVERPASPAPATPPGDAPADSDMAEQPESRTQPPPPTPS